MPRPPPEECQLFNMEPALGKLEALFQNAKAQLDWIKNQLECEIRENLPEGAGAEEDPFALLEELSVVGSRHEALCQQMEQILTERQQIMEDIGANVQDTVRILQELQENVGLESSALSAEEQAAAQQLGFQIGENMESPVEEDPSLSVPLLPRLVCMRAVPCPAASPLCVCHTCSFPDKCPQFLPSIINSKALPAAATTQVQTELDPWDQLLPCLCSPGILWKAGKMGGCCKGHGSFLSAVSG
ncbi:spindle and kinetochore-associated protein 2 isoform X1 [Pithys albifrons albifrons]|uniref:spindle and kinetochore-associated protein 2 isoform X1 n=1 Tax=Pithys albifrons albifrons TaxID=3385563 RepID=UPI003A5D1458